MVFDNSFRLVTLGRLALLTPAGEEDDSLGKQRLRLALLAVLALSKRPLPREALAEMFWGDQNEARARHSLDNALSHFRRVLGGNALARRQIEIALAVDAPLRVDAVELAEAVAAGEYSRAAALYTGPFLDGIHIEGSVRLERWLESERIRLEALFLEACRKQCHALARRREWGACAELAGRWLDVAPASGDAGLYRLNALKAPGTREAQLTALAEYERIRVRLEREYELAPDEAVVALASDIANRLEESAPVQSGEARPADEPAAAPVSAETGAARVRTEPTSSLESSPARLGPGAPARTPVRTRQWLVFALAFSVLAAVALVARERRDGFGVTRVGTGVLAPRERILIADFENHTSDSLLGVAITEAFRVDLTQSRAVKVVPPGAVRDVLDRMKRPALTPLDVAASREVALRDGINVVIAGDIAAVGSRYVISAKMLSAETGEVLAAVRETADDSTRIIGAVDRLSKRLRQQIGESLRSIRGTPALERVTTASLEALRKHSQAVRAYYVEGDEAKALTLWERAIVLDSTFAAAHQGLAAILFNRVDRRARAVEALTSAFRYRTHLTERERYLVEGAYHLRVTAEPEKAAVAYRLLLDMVPDDQTALNNLGNAYGESRDFARAEQTYRRAIELDSSDSFVKYANVLHYQVIFGRLDAAEKTFTRARAKFPGNDIFESFAASLAAARGDYPGAESRLLSHLETLKTGDAGLRANTLVALASLAVLRGEIAQAERHLAVAAAVHEERGAPEAAVEVAVLAGYLDVWFRAAPERGLKNVHAALAKHPLAKMSSLDRPYLPLASFFAQAGEPALARAHVIEYEAIEPALRRREEPARHSALGAIALAEGRPGDAVAEFRLADRGNCPVCALPDLGRAYDAAGMADSAAAVYERYSRHNLTTLWLFPRYFSYEASRAGIYKRLGELYEERSDHGRAAHFYGRFLDLWKDADPERRPIVEDVARRLARLREPV